MKKLWRNILEWKQEAVAILLSVALFMFAPHFLRYLDPTAGAYDAGVLHLVLFALVAVLSFSFFSWVGIKINFGEVFNYLQTDFEKDFKSLDKWQKQKISLLLYFGYLVLFVLMARAL